jgi:hypothetical protein
MRFIAVIGTSVLGMLLATTGVARAQHGNDDDSRKHGDNKHDDRKHEDKHEKDHGRPAKHEDRREDRHEADRHDHGRPEHQQPHIQQGHGPEHVHDASWHEHEQHRHEAWDGHRAKHWEHEHHNWHERGGYRGYRIPENHFRAHFGRAHWFRVHTVPVVVVGGYPRFQYGGFWFSMVDPWPEYWAHNWYETDDVYVDYVNDGYYMYNRRHPGVAIAINVSL